MQENLRVSTKANKTKMYQLNFELKIKYLKLLLKLKKVKVIFIEKFIVLII